MASYTQGYGRNIVNVILVDIRALDTMGEIVVLALAAMGVCAYLPLNPIHAPSYSRTGGRNERGERIMGTQILREVSWFTPVFFMFAFFVLLRGHHEPGGGFIAGDCGLWPGVWCGDALQQRTHAD